MMRRLLAATVLSLAIVGLSPMPASAAETVLTVDTIVVDSHGVAAQSVHISGNTNQTITVEFPDGAPSFYEAPFRYGQQPCAMETPTRYRCEGTSDGVYIAYYGPVDMDVTRSFRVVATAADLTQATGTVSVQVLADVRVAGNFTQWRTYEASSTTATLIVGEHNFGPALGHDLVVRVTGLDTSLGLPAGCQVVDSGVVECARPNLPVSPELVVRRSLELTVPYCQVHRSVMISIETITQTDPQPANNTVILEAIPTYGSAICSGGSGGSGGSGSSGSASQSGGQGSTGSTSPAGPGTSSTVDATSTPLPTTDGSTEPTEKGRALAAAPTDGDQDLTWWWIFIGVGGPIALGAGALGGWWWRRRPPAMRRT